MKLKESSLERTGQFLILMTPLILASLFFSFEISAQSCVPARGDACVPRILIDCCSPLRCTNHNGGICYLPGAGLSRGETCYSGQECTTGLSCTGGVCCDTSLDLGGGSACYCSGECASNNCSGGVCTNPQCSNFPNCFCCPRFEPGCDESDCGMSYGSFSKDSSKNCPILGGRPSECCCGDCALLGKSCSSYSCCPDAVCLGGICKNEHFRGESCDPSYYFCSSGLNCVGTTCCDPALSLPGNSVCYCDDECDSGQCTGGHCYIDPCEGVDCGSCAYCSGGNCLDYCSGSNDDCGCSSCVDCDTLDGWVNEGTPFNCCDGEDRVCMCRNQTNRDYYCSGTSCSFSTVGSRVAQSSCYDCPSGRYCAEGTGCLLPQTRGEACSPSAPCNAGLDCVDGACCDPAIALSGGTSCYCNDECISGDCENGQCASGIVIMNPVPGTDLADIIKNIINFIFTASLFIAPLMIIIAAFVLATAAGDTVKVDTAKKIILWTVVGFLVVLLSKGIFQAVQGLF